MSDEAAAVIAFTTGIIAGALARSDSALRCDVYAPTVANGRAVLPILTAGGLHLEIEVRER